MRPIVEIILTTAVLVSGFSLVSKTDDLPVPHNNFVAELSYDEYTTDQLAPVVLTLLDENKDLKDRLDHQKELIRSLNSRLETLKRQANRSRFS